MYTIAAIDDEAPAIQCIESILQRYDRPFQLVTARSGREALLKLKTQKPHVLLVDIEMQGMDGFKLIDAIHASCNPEAKAILVTAYSQFEYCKKAIGIRAFDYILKPVKERELLSAIEKAFNELEASEKQVEEREVIGARYIAQSLRRYLKERMPDEAKKEALRELSAYLYHRTYLCVVLRLARRKPEIEDHAEWLAALLRGNGANRATRMMVVELEPLEFAVIGGLTDSEDAGVMVQTIRFAASGMNGSGLGVSAVFADLNELADRLDRCVTASRQRLMEQGAESARVYNQETSHFALASGDAVKDPAVSVAAERLALAGEDAATLVKFCLERKRFDGYLAFRETLLYLLTRIQQIASEHGANLEPATQLEAVVGRSQSIEEIAEWASAQAEAVVRHMQSRQSTSAWQNVQRVIHYIDRHYRDQLTLNDVAAMASVHTAYFCELFKKITGETYVEYLTRLRIEKAKQLLAEGKLSVSKLAERIGYEDPNYFRRVFRKYTGMSPRQYRKRFA